MKTVVRLIVLACTVSLILVILPAISHYDTMQARLQKDLRLKEDSIDLNKHVVERSDGDDRKKICREKIFYNCKTPLRSTIDSIDINHFAQLEDIAIKLNPTHKGQHILALRLIYALNGSNQLMLIYQPLFLKKNKPGSEMNTFEYLADTSKSYYIYSHTSIPHFQVIDTVEFRKAVQAYKTNIKFKTGSRKGMMECRGFNFDSDSTGDVRSHVFSFQEMKSVVRDHKAKVLYILNAAETFRIKGNDYLKHALLLGSEEVNKKTKAYDSIFYRKYGNLSHLCPPSCGATPYIYKLKD